MQRDERQERELQLFACAVGAMETPPQSTSQMPLAFTNYVALSLSKLPPALYRRVKKHISDVLYEMEEQNDVEPGRCNVNDNIPQYGPRHYPSTFNSTLIIDPLVLVQPPAISITKPLMFPVETSK